VKSLPNVFFRAVVEGDTDEAVALRLLEHVAVSVDATYGRNGKQWIREKMSGFLNAANYSPWLVIVDLDTDADCAPPVVPSWVPSPPPKLLCFRIAVKEIEAWLLSDGETLASFLSIAQSRVPSDPESHPDPKETMVSIARRSRRRAIREDMCPRPGSGRSVGPAYASRLIEYASTLWRPGVAAEVSLSLRKTITCIERVRDLAVKATRGDPRV
jgi:hypothetical protein